MYAISNTLSYYLVRCINNTIRYIYIYIHTVHNIYVCIKKRTPHIFPPYTLHKTHFRRKKRYMLMPKIIVTISDIILKLNSTLINTEYFVVAFNVSCITTTLVIIRYRLVDIYSTYIYIYMCKINNSYV